MTMYTAQIDRFSHDARGIARINGKITFVSGALPGETVTLQVVRSKKHFDEAEVIEVLNASQNRITPPCRHYAACGGCTLQHLDSSVQIQVKQAEVLHVLERIGRVTPITVLNPLVSSPWQYRHKARLSIDVASTGLLLGFKQKQSAHTTVAIQECPVLTPQAASFLQPLSVLINRLDVRCGLHSIEIAVGENDCALIVRHQGILSMNDRDTLRHFAVQAGVQLWLAKGKTTNPERLYPDELNSALLRYSLPEHQVTLAFNPSDFTQINPEINRLMVNQAIQLLELSREDTVLDLFCGIGNFTLPIARYCRQVIGIEGVDALVARGQMNATMNAIHNAVFQRAALDQPRWINAVPVGYGNKMLLDPPRTGALAVVKQINRQGPERLVYVSCDAATLARDAGILVHEQGYRLVSVGVMDMFPQTAHVETMALFQKQGC